MSFKTVFTFVTLVLVAASAQAQITSMGSMRDNSSSMGQDSKKSGILDYIVADYGQFIGDNTNYNGILRVKKEGSKLVGEIHTATSQNSMGGGSMMMGSMGSSMSSDPFASTVPEELVATMNLSQSNDGAYVISKLVIVSKSSLHTRGLIFSNGGTIDFNGQNNFGGPVIIYRDQGANGFKEIDFVGPVKR